MKIEVLLFGVVKEIAGRSKLTLDFDSNITSVSNLKKLLIDKFPETKKLKSLLVAINESYANDEDTIKSGDEIAIIPPVSGG